MLAMCSWNIHLGIELNTILRTIEHYPDFHNLDVLLLQECAGPDGTTDAERIAAALGPTYRVHQRTVDRFHGHRRGLAVVWNADRIDLNRFELLPLPRLRECTVSRWQRYSLQPIGMRPRAALLAEGPDVRLYVIHLSPMGFNFQAEQLAVILRDDERRAAARAVVMAGDFNSLRMDRRKWRRWLAQREAEGFIEVSKDVDWTYWTNALPFRQKLDNALVRGPGIEQSACWSPELGGSDHLPLFFTLNATLD